MRYPKHLQKVIELFKRLPGVGNRSAERFAFNVLGWPEEHLHDLAITLHDLKSKLIHCKECGCITDENNCPFCVDPRKEARTLCIISSPRDAFAIEDTGEYFGLYHVLGGLLSPLEGIGPERLAFAKLRERVVNLQIKEVVIALDSTIEGDTTALYLKRELDAPHLTFTRLAFGMPIGSSLDYVDGSTLARALSGRSNF